MELKRLPILPTASRLDLANACPASCVLPSEDGEPGDAVYRGNVAHKYLEDIANGITQAVALQDVPVEMLPWIRALPIERMFQGLGNVRPEVPYAVNVITRFVRVLNGGHRDYADRTDDEFVGTVDLIATRPDGRALIRDYKTGANLGDPATKLQLRFAALALHLETGAQEIDVEFAYILQDGAVQYDTATLNVWDFDETFETLVRLRESITQARHRYSAGEPLSVRTGQHCRFCPAFWSCPAKIGALRTVTQLDVRRLPTRQSALREFWQKYEETRQIIDRAKPLVTEYVDRDEIPLDDHTCVRMITSTKREYAVEKLKRLALSLGATDAQLLGCVSSNTFSYPKVVKRK